MFAKLIEWPRQLLGLVLPLFAKAKDWRGVGLGVRILLHVLMLALILAGLWWINQLPVLYGNLAKLPFKLNYFWMPILFLLLYTVVWLGWWLWQMLHDGGVSSPFPDIDAAWEMAVEALRQKKLEVTSAPLYLILGRPSGSERSLFAGSESEYLVKNAPPSDQPLHVFAHRNGIYLTCPGVSLLSRQADFLAGPVADDALPARSNEAVVQTLNLKAAMLNPESMGANPAAQVGKMVNILSVALQGGRSPDQLTVQEKLHLRQELRRASVALLKNKAEVQKRLARLQHLCRLIARDRQPYCPINAILLLVPVAASDTDEDANDTATICQQELNTVKNTLQVRAPLIALVCDMETLPGFQTFAEQFPREMLKQPLGKGVPLVPDVAPAQLPNMVDGLMRWIATTLIPAQIAKFLRVEVPGKLDYTVAVRNNSRLVQLMDQMRARHKRLATVLRKWIGSHGDEPPLFRGCYLAATGSTPDKQAFIPGVLQRLEQNENFVAWSAEALAEDSSYRRQTALGYLGVFAMIAALAALVWWSFWGKSQ